MANGFYQEYNNGSLDSSLHYSLKLRVTRLIDEDLWNYFELGEKYVAFSETQISEFKKIENSKEFM